MSALGVGSWWPEGVERQLIHSFNASSLHPLPPQQQLVVHTLITHCNYTLPPLPSANRSLIPRKQTSPISASTRPTMSPPIEQRRIISISQQQQSHHHNQQVCCDHQFTDRCSVRESSTRPRSSPLRLDPQASPDGALRLPLHLAHSTHSTPTRT